MSRTRGGRRPRWLFYFAVGSSWLFGAEIVVLTAAKRSLPGRAPVIAGWAFVAVSAIFLVAVARLELTSRRQTTSLINQLNEALTSITALTEASLSALSLDRLLDRFLERLKVVLHTEVTAILVFGDDHSDLRALACETPKAIRPDVVQLAIEDGGIVARVVASAAPRATTDPRELDRFATAIGERLSSAAACPILVEGRLIGVCVAASASRIEFDTRELHLLQLVADRAGLGIERTRLDESERRSRLDAERAHRHALVLAATSAALSTARDDYRSNFAAIGEVAVPAFCDWCVVDLLDEGDLLRLRTDDASENLTSSRVAPDIGAVLVSAVRRALESGETQFVLAEGSGNSTNADAIAGAQAEPGHYIVVSIQTTRGPLGAITFGFRGDELAASCVATAEDIARRAATAADRVSLYLEAREMAWRSDRVAIQLQRLLGASLAIATLRSEPEVISAIASWALRISGAERAVVSVDLDGGPVRAVAATGAEVVVGSPGAASPEFDLPEELLAPRKPGRHEGWLATPIVGLAGRSIGTVATWRGDELAFVKEDETLLILLAQMTSTALAGAALYRTLYDSEARWRTLVESAPVGIIEVDLAGKGQWANPAAVAIFGEPAENEAPAYLQALSGRNVEYLVPLWLQAADGATIHDRELLEVRVGGETKDLLVSVSRLASDDGSVHGLLTLAADITDRRRLQERLRQAQQMEAVGQLAGSVAHDFNNLLTLIAGYAELLRAQPGLGSRELELAESVQTVTDRAALLTGRLLTISRRDHPRPIVIAPARAIASIMEVLGRILGENIELDCALSDDAGYMRVDPGHLDQLVLNLAVNARDAMPDGGCVQIGITSVPVDIESAALLEVPPGTYIRLAVSDDGVGMDPETLARCFDPFFTTKAPQKGTGLGLAAVRAVVTECDGAIEVSSEIGAGTTFEVYFPAVDAPVVSRAMSVEAAGGETVLVVEDDEDVRHLMVRVLEKAGFRVLSADGGLAALEVSRRWGEGVDLLVSDVSMPGMDGPNLAASLENERPGIPVLFVSSDASGITQDLLSDSRGFLAKPFRPSQLIREVRALLDARAAPGVGQKAATT